ncbi:hypothetical protein HON22_03035 [Candidatus Peregrinibacteria bacterium]|nr:hypothetical protein [Candidatus Peregrinibacteria bacterium]
MEIKTSRKIEQKAFHKLPYKFTFKVEQALLPKNPERIKINLKPIKNLRDAQEALNLLQELRLKREMLDTSRISGKEYWGKWYYIDGKGEIFNGLHTGFGALSHLNTSEHHGKWFDDNIMNPIVKIINLAEKISHPYRNFDVKSGITEKDLLILQEINKLRGIEGENNKKYSKFIFDIIFPIKQRVSQQVQH